jgi:hypothetical protein
MTFFSTAFCSPWQQCHYHEGGIIHHLLWSSCWVVVVCRTQSEDGFMFDLFLRIITEEFFG